MALAGPRCPHSCLNFQSRRYTPVLRPLALSFRPFWHAQRGTRLASSRRLPVHSHSKPKRFVHIAAVASPEAAKKAPKKSIFYRQLADAASRGYHEAAEDCVLAMKDAGLELTAHTYHGLIFCYAKAGVTEAAVRYFYLCLGKGIQPLPETYAVVIHSCLANYATAIAEEIYANLLSASVDRRPGWESYVRGLASLGLRTTYPEDDALLVEEARQAAVQESTGAEASASQEADNAEGDQTEAAEDSPAGSLDDDSEEEDEEEEMSDLDAQAQVPDSTLQQDRDQIVHDTEEQEEEAELQEDIGDTLSNEDDEEEESEEEEEEDGSQDVAVEDALQVYDELGGAVREGADPDGDYGVFTEAGLVPVQGLKEAYNPLKDGYRAVLFTEEPLDLDNLSGVEINEALVSLEAELANQTGVAGQSPEGEEFPATSSEATGDAPESAEDATGSSTDAAKAGFFEEMEDQTNSVIEIEPLQIVDVEYPEGQEPPPPDEEVVPYHPGAPDGKIQLVAKITETMEYGRQEGWYMDLDTYEDVLRLLCEDPEQAILAQEILSADLMERPDVQPETRHFNCILRAEAIWRGVRHAKMTVDDMIEGKYGLDIRPDIQSMNALLEGCVAERMTGKAYAIEDFQETVATIITSGLSMNKRTHALQLMMYLLDNDLDKVVWELQEMQGLAAPNMALEELSDYWLTELISFLMENKCVLEVLRLLVVMSDDERDMPEELCQWNEEGRTFTTSWLPNFYSTSHEGRNNAGLLKHRQQESVEYQGVVLDADTGEALSSETGLPLPVAEMGDAEVRAELELRDIPATGSGEQRALRLQRARDGEPEKIPEFSGEKSDRLLAKQQIKDKRKAEKDATVPFWVETISVDMVNNTKAMNMYMTTFLEESKDAEDGSDDQFFETLNNLELSPEITGLMKEYRSAVNTKDLERQYMLESRIFNTETPEFLEINPHFHGQPGFGLKDTWPPFGRGARLALFMMELSNQMGGTATFLDFIQMLEGFIIERDAEGCYQLITLLHPQAAKLSPEDVTLFYNKALTLCLECREMAFVSDIGSMMEEYGIEPLGLLDYEETLPGLRAATEYAAQMPDYEKEVGLDLGEALGGAETYRMSDLEGKPPQDPEDGNQSIYSQPRDMEEILSRVEFLPDEDIDEDDEAEEEEEEEAEEGDMEEPYWQGNGAGPDRVEAELASSDSDDDPNFDDDWEPENGHE